MKRKIDYLLGNPVSLLNDLCEKQILASSNGLWIKVEISHGEIKKIGDNIISNLMWRNFFLLEETPESYLKMMEILHPIEKDRRFLIKQNEIISCLIVNDKDNPTIMERFPDRLASYYSRLSYNKINNSKSFIESPELIKEINKNKFFYIHFPVLHYPDLSLDPYILIQKIKKDYQEISEEQINNQFDLLSTHSKREAKKVLALFPHPLCGLPDLFNYYWFCNLLYYKLLNQRIYNNYSITLKSLLSSVKNREEKIKNIQYKENVVKTYKLSVNKSKGDYSLKIKRDKLS
jgi:hypothetical protein